MMDTDLSRRQDAERHVPDRRIILLDLFFSRYADVTGTRVIRYEDVIASKGRALSIINPRVRSA